MRGWQKIAAGGLLWLALFTVISSVAFVGMLEWFEPAKAGRLLGAFPSAWFWIWWPYLKGIFHPVTQARLLISGACGLLVPPAFIIPFYLKSKQVHGWPPKLGRAKEKSPAAAMIADTDGYGRARFSTPEENARRWLG
jgi:hypothetical protein